MFIVGVVVASYMILYVRDVFRGEVIQDNRFLDGHFGAFK